MTDSMCETNNIRDLANGEPIMSNDCCNGEAEEGMSAREQVADSELAVLCKALGHPARVRILRHLAGHGTCFFGDLAPVVGLSPSTVSQHVTMLKESGLIMSWADERRVCYCINPDRLAVLKRLVEGL